MSPQRQSHFSFGRSRVARRDLQLGIAGRTHVRDVLVCGACTRERARDRRGVVAPRRKRGGPGVRDAGPPGSHPPLVEGAAPRGLGERRRHRGEADPHERSRRAIREPGRDPGDPLRRQARGHDEGYRAGDRSRGSRARRPEVLRHPPAPASFERAPLGEGAGARIRVPNGRNDALDNEGHRLADRVRQVPRSPDCGSRSTPRSIPGTAGGRRSSATG